LPKILEAELSTTQTDENELWLRPSTRARDYYALVYTRGKVEISKGTSLLRMGVYDLISSQVGTLEVPLPGAVAAK
jgi:hypothetical protein